MMLTWKTDLPEGEWDRLLASLGGHPLQSALWGKARSAVSGIEERRIAAFCGDTPVWMSRFEVRRLPGGMGRAAWVPKGPVVSEGDYEPHAHAAFLDGLRYEGFWMAVENRYTTAAAAPNGLGIPLSAPYRTIWVDLAQGEEALWRRLHKQWRYRIPLAERAGVIVEQTRDAADVSTFFRLCHDVSVKKGFTLPSSEPLMQALIAEPAGPHTDARLFVARCERQIVAGALALRCGHSVHYFWGGTDRHFDKPFGGVAVHWGVMKWGIEQGLARYDLEGINPKSNPGVYQFKVRAGGEEVVLPGQVGYGLDWRGRWMLSLGRRLSRRPGRRGIGAE